MCAGGELLAVGQRDAVLDAGGMGEPPAGDGDLQARSHTEREQRAMARSMSMPECVSHSRLLRPSGRRRRFLPSVSLVFLLWEKRRKM